MCQENLHQRLALVGRMASQKPVERAAQGINVGSMVGYVAVQCLLRRHVVAGAHHLAGRRQPFRAARACLGPRDESQAHVEDLDGAFLIQKQVARLDVAVDDALAVGVLKPASRLQDVLDRLGDRERPMIPDDAGQVLAIDVLHGQVVHPLMLTSVVGRDDVRVFQLGRRLHLAVEPLDSPSLLHGRRGEDLDCHQPFHSPVLGLQHYAHAAFAQLIQYDVFAEDQPLGLALVDGLGLVLGQLAVLDQRPGELLDILGPLVGRQAVLERGDFGRRHQSALRQPHDELLDRDRHVPDPRPDHWGTTIRLVYPDADKAERSPSIHGGLANGAWSAREC